MLEPVVPTKIDLLESLGAWFIMSFSGFSRPRAKAGRESVTRFMNRIWVGRRKMLSGIKREVMKIPRTSTRLVEIRNRIVFVILR